ncbi:MAG: HEAT repeat domain-containing protein [Deltaproteobacteria bacterium]|nr:HEAT repeat domain-containing protein [Deltaproteobacteria bacterium]
MAHVDRMFQHRGAVTGLRAQGDALWFTTRHAEGHATALYRLDLDKVEQKAYPLPCGGLDLDPDGDDLLVTAENGQIYRLRAGEAALAPIGPALSPAGTALAVLSKGRLGVLRGALLSIVSAADGAVLQDLELPEAGTAIVADPTGHWIAVGTAGGKLCAFDDEDKERFLGGEAVKAHEGAVTTLCFEPGELRVLSAGVDNKLLSTHLRGRLEPEDRGGGAAHDGPVRGIAIGAEEHSDRRFYTAGDDGVLKAWPLGAGRKRPTTTKDWIAKSVGLIVVKYKARPALALALLDGSIRILLMDAAGKVGEAAITARGALAWADAELGRSEPQQREDAMRTLARWGDAESVSRLNDRARGDEQVSLRGLAAELLAQSDHPSARKLLTGLLSSNDAVVRLNAFNGLRRISGPESLDPLNAALSAKKADLGQAAVKVLQGMAPTDELAMARLVQALRDEPQEVRTAALYALEAIHPDGDPAADLLALDSNRADVRRLALLRLKQRGLLHLAETGIALRRHGEDKDADVRVMAFLVNVSSRPLLAEALRHRDRDLHRQLFELDTWGLPDDPDRKPPKTKKVDAATLSGDDLRPLLEAMASRALDTCLRGAVGLASLGDSRALGALLQLSRDGDKSARVQACKALEALGDARALNRLRLMIRDAAPEVRDAAFSALTRILEATPLEAADAGLHAEHDDVRKRALQVLTAKLRASKTEDPVAIALLQLALNDIDAGVRGEALKAALNLGVSGGGANTQRFALRSLHVDVRREVLTEIMARPDEPWAWGLLLELFDDPDATLRSDAFAFAQKRAKGRRLEPLAAALRCQHPDLRRRAAKELAEKRSDGGQALLVKALEDDDAEVRSLAIGALVTAEAHDALSAALTARWADVRVRAASARAAHGDPAALGPLLEVATEAKPETGKGDPAAWESRVITALGGLGGLGEPGALEPVAALLSREQPKIRLAAVEALAWISRPGQLDALRAALRHSDAEVRLKAAFGLAINGDAAGVSLLFARPKAADTSNNRNKRNQPAAPTEPTLGEPERLQAALALGESGRGALLSLLDTDNAAVRRRALLSVALLELAEPQDPPSRLLSALSAASGLVRLAAAELLERCPDAADFRAAAVERVNDRSWATPISQSELMSLVTTPGRAGSVPPWTVDEDVVMDLTAALASADPQLRARGAAVLAGLELPTQERFEAEWKALRARAAAALDAGKAEVARRLTNDARSKEATLRPVVFGACVGLAREGGSNEAGVRVKALSRLLAMAVEEPGLGASVEPVMVLALSDPMAPVRITALNALQRLGMEPARLGAEALAASHQDVGALGMRVLAEQAGGDAAVNILRRVALERTDGMQTPAANLIAERQGEVVAGRLVLDARDANLRQQGLAWLAKMAPTEPAAVDALRAALGSRHAEVRLGAARRLAERRDGAAWDLLVKVLNGDDTRQMREARDGLIALGDPRVVDALLDRVDRPDKGSGLGDELIRFAADLRVAASLPRLLKLADVKELRRASLYGALTVTGYDQDIDDTEDERLHDRAWLKDQHPRSDEGLVELTRKAAALGEDRMLSNELLPSLRWAPSAVVDAALAALVGYNKPEIRQEVMEAIGWRLRKRAGPSDTLLRALQSPEVELRFLAAEGLALADRNDGATALLAAVELMPELDWRVRAVKALGPLADARALELLSRLATEEGHALQEAAAEALGHLSTGDRAEQVLKTLTKLAEGSGEVALSALSGLRHFGSEPAWVILRARAKDDNWRVRQVIAEVLADERTEAGLDVLRKLIDDHDGDVSGAAVESLRARLGPDSLEPDLLAARSPRGLDDDEGALERIVTRATAAQLFTLLNELKPDRYQHQPVIEAVSVALLGRKPAPAAEAAAALGSEKQAVVTLAARLVGRGADASHGPALVTALGRLGDKLDALRARLSRGADAEATEEIPGIASALEPLVWACGRLGVGAERVLPLASLPGAELGALRRAAILAIGAGLGGEAGLSTLERLSRDGDADERSLAAHGLRGLNPARAEALAAGALEDPVRLARLIGAGGASDALRAGLTKTAWLGSVLPILVGRGDVAGLAAALGDRSLPEAARLGAIEALGRLEDPAVEAPLRAVATSTAEDEELRKAAWRALRRARRQRSRAQETHA